MFRKLNTLALFYDPLLPIIQPLKNRVQSLPKLFKNLPHLSRLSFSRAKHNPNSKSPDFGLRLRAVSIN